MAPPLRRLGPHRCVIRAARREQEREDGEVSLLISIQEGEAEMRGADERQRGGAQK